MRVWVAMVCMDLRLDEVHESGSTGAAKNKWLHVVCVMVWRVPLRVCALATKSDRRASTTLLRV